MPTKVIDIVHEILENKIDVSILENLCALCESLRFSYTLEEMVNNISNWFQTHYNIQHFSFDLHDMNTNINYSIMKKGDSFDLNDKNVFFFIIDTKTELNAMASFKASTPGDNVKITENYKYIETLFLQISPVLQGSILKRIHIDANSIDTVTHVYNRTSLLKTINKTLSLSEEKKDNITFLMIGIDRFKAVIDEFTYDIGDKVLVALAKVIHSNIKEKDIVARLTGDEFLVALLHESDQDTIIKVVTQIIEEFANTEIIVNDTTKQILKKTVCIGVSKYPQDSDDIDAVIKNSDRFLYEAKQNARSTYAIYEKEIETTIDFF